jgi:nitroreductase
MLSRRDFVKTTLYAGVLLGAGALTGCRGTNRKGLRDFQDPQSALPSLDPTWRAILYHASLAPSGHNSQPWRVRIVSRDTWMIEADPDRRLPAVDPQNRELLLSLGAFVENLSLAAGAMGWGTDIVVIGRERHDREVVLITLHRDKPTAYDVQAIRNRRTVRQGYMPKEIAAAHVRILAEQTDGHLAYFPRGSEHAACLRDATVENYRVQAGRDEAQQELVRWLRLDDRAVREHRDGLSLEGMEITGIKGWFLRHFAEPADFFKVSYRQQGIDGTAALAAQGGGWIIINSPGQTVSDLIASGRRFQRLALSAQELGIGIQPMSQVLEEESGMALIAANHPRGLWPQFVLRVGYLTHFPAPVSPRIPVEGFVYKESLGQES